jgi:hypothetical protein
LAALLGRHGANEKARRDGRAWSWLKTIPGRRILYFILADFPFALIAMIARSRWRAMALGEEDTGLIVRALRPFTLPDAKGGEILRHTETSCRNQAATSSYHMRLCPPPDS